MTGGGLAKALLRHAAAVMPPSRAEWAEAMMAEAERVPADEQLGFALGCVRSSYEERMMDAATIVTAGRWAIGIGLAAGTAVCMRTAYVLRHDSSSALVLLLGLICLAATAAFLRFGLKPLPKIALGGLAAALVAMLVAGDVAALTGAAAPSGRFYRAILLEQAAAWGTLIVVAQLLLALERRRSARG